MTVEWFCNMIRFETSVTFADSKSIGVNWTLEERNVIFWYTILFGKKKDGLIQIVLPVCNPIRSCSFLLGLCLIRNVFTASKSRKDMRAISLAWFNPFLTGSPETTMYASPIVSICKLYWVNNPWFIQLPFNQRIFI